MRRLFPEGLAGRFMLLLAAALIAANVAALILLSVDRVQGDRAALAQREIERVVSLVPAIEAVAAAERMRIAAEASTRFSRVTVTADALVGPAAGGLPRVQRLVQSLGDVLPGREVRASLIPARGEDRGRLRIEALAISIQLRGPVGQWLNVATRPLPQDGPGFDDRLFFLLLSLSLVSTLGVSWLFLRRLTGPLTRLTAATRAAGRGDRSVRVVEGGARELRELGAAFNAMQASIAQFDAERMRTMGAVGHDLRTPITSLRIRAEMLDSPEAGAMIRTLDEMTVMADGLVAFARGAAEAEEVNRVDLTALVTRLCAERGAVMTKAGSVWVQARPVALGRALGNLIDNAVRYAGQAQVAVSTADGAAVVTVSDRGPGIDPTRLDATFDPFVRGDNSRNADTGGAGLGLSIARNIVLSHGGTITLANRDGGGLRARVTLPRA
ncbi:ATP-binding protein [Loktanella sp. 3ANDIMAR09]|uniref:ATP-binding protein n=1 Tax=Loktanella sp. 3ANDIMAR09 TaxID=1225657 RepID=UPI0006FAB463|nr:ATP-binding protein [Loktanella sp. 3ANDIMAR09]